MLWWVDRAESLVLPVRSVEWLDCVLEILHTPSAEIWTAGLLHELGGAVCLILMAEGALDWIDELG